MIQTIAIFAAGFGASLAGSAALRMLRPGKKKTGAHISDRVRLMEEFVVASSDFVHNGLDAAHSRRDIGSLKQGLDKVGHYCNLAGWEGAQASVREICQLADSANACIAEGNTDGAVTVLCEMQEKIGLLSGEAGRDSALFRY